MTSKTASRPPTPIGLGWVDSPTRAVCVALFVALLAAGGALGLNGIGAIGWHAAVRITAVLAYPLWLAAFSAAALVRFFPTAWTRGLRKRRRAVGLAFAVILGVHAGTILGLSRIEPDVITPGLEVYFGGGAMLLTLAMALTSNDAAVRALGRGWPWLHRTGQAVLAIVFLFSYGGRAAVDADYWPAFALLIGALGLRGAAFAQSLRLRRTTLPTE